MKRARRNATPDLLSSVFLTIEQTLQAAGERPIIIALSGGGDSVALMHVLASHVGPARLHAVVIDHALRQGSAADAARAASFARALGVSAEVRRLNWDLGPPASSPAGYGEGRRDAGGPSKRSQATARRARYSALSEAARAHGARITAVAHTGDDQAETVFMRAAKGSGWRGLAGMAALAPAPVWPEGRGLMLARPLLHARRAALRTDLQARGAEWIEDPANANPAFERVRTRIRLASMESGGFDAMRLADFAAKVRALVDRVDADAADLIARAARCAGPRIDVDLAAWDAPPESRRRALSVLIAAAAGAEREPAPNALERLEARLAGPAFVGAALGGARLQRSGQRLRLSRDPGGVSGRVGQPPAPPLNVAAGQTAVWDGRLELRAACALRVVPDRGGPVVEHGGSRLGLDEAVSRGLISAHWLGEQQLQHLLAPFMDVETAF
ncbi:MAG: tRNA lysidine(34) synthetase TilS [Hyphomonadaceae bacterium]|nr:tRNA lysidine(34) synthetase TilS [Hyphomonadaceae bacterium]